MPAYINCSGTNKPAKASYFASGGQAVKLGGVGSSFIGPLLQQIYLPQQRAYRRSAMGKGPNVYGSPIFYQAIGIETLKTVLVFLCALVGNIRK